MSLAELLKQLDAVIEAKIFSLEEGKAIQQIREEYDKVVLHNLELTSISKDLEEVNSKLIQTLDDERRRTTEMALELSTISARENELIGRENIAAKNIGQAIAYRTIFELMFKNTAVER